MRRLQLNVDTSVIGGCEDPEFAEDSLALWRSFIRGTHLALLSAHTLRELEGAPARVRRRIREIPRNNVLVLPDDAEAVELAQAYVDHGVLGPGSRSDALHVALATTANADVLVSWNFRHIVNLARSYRLIEIRSPRELLYA